MEKSEGDQFTELTTIPESLSNGAHQNLQVVMHENAATDTDSRGIAAGRTTITGDLTNYLPSNANKPPIKITHRALEGDTSNKKTSTVHSFIAEREYQKEVERHTPILTEWIGTSQYFVMEGIAMQEKVSIIVTAILAGSSRQLYTRSQLTKLHRAN